MSTHDGPRFNSSERCLDRSGLSEKFARPPDTRRIDPGHSGASVGSTRPTLHNSLPVETRPARADHLHPAHPQRWGGQRATFEGTGVLQWNR